MFFTTYVFASFSLASTEGKTFTASSLTICAPGVVVSETFAVPISVPAEMLTVPACRQLSSATGEMFTVPASRQLLSVAAEIRDADGLRKTKWPCFPMTGRNPTLALLKKVPV